MIDIGTSLRHYKRKDIQEAMVASAHDREIAVKYGDRGFGKRPDVLSYPRDVLEFAKNRATSFHVSEEHWSNPLSLGPAMRKKEMEDLRSGWDLVIDIDCPDWKISKIVSWLVVRSLEDHGLKSISCKFSGNKGFHIGVPMKAFPKSIHNTEIRKWFPDGPKRIAMYLLDYISNKYIKVKDDKILFAGRYEIDISTVLDSVDKELYVSVCKGCGKERKEKTQEFDFICSKCGYQEIGTDKMKSCAKCGFIMEKKVKKTAACECGETKVKKIFDTAKIVDIDTLLISSRHMYRMPYSLHEKSGLYSIPIGPNEILRFDKKMADPSSLQMPELIYLDDSKTKEGEASKLVLATFDHSPRIETERKKNYELEFETLTEAIPPDFWPPCIHNIMAGLEDGKKRSMFILINFFSNTGYEYDKIDELLHEWNDKNKEPLREVLIKGQVRYRRTQKDKVLPPNCNNMAYYKNFQVCTPDAFCARIKNPVNYAVLQSKINQKKAGGRKKLTDEQKEMRRKHREKIKKHNQ